MIEARGIKEDWVAANLRSIVLEVENLLRAIEEHDTVMHQELDVSLKKVILFINLLRRGIQERRFV